MKYLEIKKQKIDLAGLANVTFKKELWGEVFLTLNFQNGTHEIFQSPKDGPPEDLLAA